MDLKLRTIIIGLISLAAVLAIYLLYSQVSKTPQIGIDTAGQFTNTQADSNVGDFDGEIGKIADVGIAALTKPVFQHLTNGQVDREFGFEELLHQVKDEWEVEKPYLNVYQPNFNCYVTADRGTVQVETAVGRPSVGDATFVGNVVIHILPQSGSDPALARGQAPPARDPALREPKAGVNESFIYLEDVAFVREKSLLSTAGPVTFASENAQMQGTGLELIYNDQLQRLEFFRIIHLESLRFKGPLASAPVAEAAPATGAGANHAQKPKEIPTADQSEFKQQEGEYYKCMLSKNVVIDAPEQFVFAQDSVSINNIFWPRASDEKSYPEQQVTRKEERETSDPRFRRDRLAPAEAGGRAKPAPSGVEGSDKETGEVVVTCDNGIVFVPMDSEISNLQFPIYNLEIENRKSKIENVPGRSTFVMRRIDYNVSTGDAVAPGPSELTFYAGTVADAKSKEAAIPVEITAQKETKFLSASNQVIFEGDCVCTMLRTEPNNVQQKYTLSAPKLIANLTSQDPNNKSRIEHLTADGGQVKLKSIRTVKGQLISGVELDCFKTEYDVGQEIFIATGPGTIRLNNSSVSEPNEQVGRFSLRRPCYAFLRDFATLKYFQKDNRIVADAEPGGTLRMDYFPIIAGKSDQQVVARASHVELDLVQTTDGQTEVSCLTASGGISYEYQDTEFLGGKLFYDPDKFIMKVWADESAPCYYNGALVDGIEIDLKTNKVKAQILTPGALQLK